MNELISLLWAIGVLAVGYALAFVVSVGIGPGIVLITTIVAWRQPQNLRMLFGFVGMLSISLAYAASVLFFAHHVLQHTVSWIVWPAIWCAAVMPPFLAQIGRAAFERDEQSERSDYHGLMVVVTVITAVCSVWFSANQVFIPWVLVFTFGCAIALLLYCVIKEQIRNKQLVKEEHQTRLSFDPDEVNYMGPAADRLASMFEADQENSEPVDTDTIITNLRNALWEARDDMIAKGVIKNENDTSGTEVGAYLRAYYQEHSEPVSTPLKSTAFATFKITAPSLENRLRLDITSELMTIGLFHWEALLRESETWSRMMDNDIRCTLPTFEDVNFFHEWKLTIIDDIPDLSLAEEDFSSLWNACKDYVETSL